MLKRIAAALALALAVPSPAIAAEDAVRLPIAAYPAPALAPTLVKSANPWEAPALRASEPGLVRKSSRRCEDSGLEICLGADGRITVPGAKKFLPEIPGLTPERLTVKRSGVVFGYSF